MSHLRIFLARTLFLIALCANPCLAQESSVLVIKGARARVEIEQATGALRLLHCEIADTARTPTGTIVVIEKLRRTPKAYPRRPGEPKRSPLGKGPVRVIPWNQEGHS